MLPTKSWLPQGMRDEGQRLTSLFTEICRGFSGFLYQEKTIYIKHFNLLDQQEIDAFYDKKYTHAREQGLPIEEERLVFLEEEGTWTSKDQEDISKKEAYIKGLERSLGKLVIASQQQQIKKTLEEQREELNKKNHQRFALLEATCEKYANTKQSNFILFASLFRDKDCMEPWFTQEEFEELSAADLVGWLNLYSNATENLVGEEIKKLAASPFFSNYFNLCGDNASRFFAAPVHEWTFYQINLINYGKIFKNIFENIPDIPEHIKDDPDALIEFANQKNKREEYQGRGEEKDAYSVMGASKEDMSKLGVKPKGGVDLHKYAAERGDSLTMKDFIDMQGG